MAAYDSLTSFESFQALSKLLYPAKKQQEQDRAAPAATGASAGPAAVGPTHIALDVKIPAPKPIRDTTDIWNTDEVAEAADDHIDDGRLQPSYEFTYKQAVSTSDAFLGMSGKDPSSTCCEDLVLKVSLPGVKSLKELDLDVQPTRVTLRSPLHKLSLALPHKVDEKLGSAKWDVKKEVLLVTLRIIRDFFDD